jgi:peptidoglycan/LPS O-acetylase OafA/YrhL
MLQARTEHSLPSLTYRPDIDGLRAIAVLVVLVFHCFPTLLSGGFVGVDVFFVISGYLIGRTSFSEIIEGKYSVRVYFARRARRIFPALIVVIISVLAAGWWLLLPVEYELLGKHVGGAALFISNWQFWREVGYFNTEATLKPLLHLWSLAVEEQFYLILPLLMLASRDHLRRLPWLLGSLALISFVSVLWGLSDHKAWAYFHILSRCWELLIGVGLAYWQSPLCVKPLPTTWRKGPASLAGVSGLLLVLGSAAGYSESTSFPGPSALIPTLGAALLIAAGALAPVNRLLAWRPLVYIGLISYPLYLWHWPLLALLRLIDGVDLDVETRQQVFLLSFPLAMITYHLIERPLRHSALARRRVFPLLLWGLLLSIGAFGFYIYKSQGLPDRRPDWDNTMRPATLASAPPPAGFTNPSKAILLGDSHALMYSESLRSYFRKHHGQELIYGFRAGCKPFYNLDKHIPGQTPEGCPRSTNPMIDQAINAPEIDTIVVVAALSKYSFSHMIYPGHEQASSNAEANYPLVDLATEDTFARLAASGKRVIVFYSTPIFPFAISECQQRPVRWRSEARNECSISISSYADQQDWSRQKLSSLPARYPNVTLFDPAKMLCNIESCNVRHGKHLIYSDNAHINAFGAQWVSQHFDF